MDNNIRNIILEKVVQLFLKIMLIYSVYLLLRGHNNPGGGFIAGIIASTGFIFYAMIYGTEKIKKLMFFSSRQWIGFGLMFVFISAIIPLFFTKEILTGVWINVEHSITGAIHLGTPLLFDTGVYFSVTGVILTIAISIMEVLKWN
ncbi:MAG TPA: MnhB domain-containing protein [Bacteroidales bacterium]|nr:MnhB domain-containing protein [Bacteroidales bacterium]